MAGSQLYHVLWHYRQIPAMADVTASCSSVPLVVIWAGLLMYSLVFPWAHFHIDCRAWWWTAQPHTSHTNVTWSHCQSYSLYHCVYMRVVGYNHTWYCIWLGVIPLHNLTSWTFFHIFHNILEHSVPIELLPAEGLMTLAIMKQMKHLCLIFYREDHLMKFYIIVDV